MTYWIVSAGANGRDYAHAFLDLGMAFVGGADPLEKHATIREGDVLILKRGVREVVAVGTVVDRGDGCTGCAPDTPDDPRDYVHDFDGWDLRGYCHVDWHTPAKPVAVPGLRIGTIYATSQPAHIATANDLLALPSLPARKREPTRQREIDDDEVLEFLIAEGLRPSAADELTDTLRKIRLLARYYFTKCDWAEIREHETRTFLVVPLLLALGWSEQQLKIEYPAGEGRRIDVACFARPFRQRGQELSVIIETKDFQSGLDYAPAQAMSYATNFPSCRGVLVTNGYCYKLYERDSAGQFSKAPSAYLNLLRPRAAYPLDPSVGGALRVLSRMLPGALIESSKPR